MQHTRAVVRFRWCRGTNLPVPKAGGLSSTFMLAHTTLASGWRHQKGKHFLLTTTKLCAWHKMVLDPEKATSSGLLHPPPKSWGLRALLLPACSWHSLSQQLLLVITDNNNWNFKTTQLQNKTLTTDYKFSMSKILGVLKNALKRPVLISLCGTKSRGGLHGEDLKNGQDITLTLFYRND